ncbi:MAG: hypothetical protein M1826_006772 [Phylliscum demangeonii]|nr:MAG: hypothetical protein M1826_006772 [Phylliscum demangeonii]
MTMRDNTSASQGQARGPPPPSSDGKSAAPAANAARFRTGNNEPADSQKSQQTRGSRRGRGGQKPPPPPPQASAPPASTTSPISPSGHALDSRKSRRGSIFPWPSPRASIFTISAWSTCWPHAGDDAKDGKGSDRRRGRRHPGRRQRSSQTTSTSRAALLTPGGAPSKKASSFLDSLSALRARVIHYTHQALNAFHDPDDYDHHHHQRAGPDRGRALKKKISRPLMAAAPHAHGDSVVADADAAAADRFAPIPWRERAAEAEASSAGRVVVAVAERLRTPPSPVQPRPKRPARPFSAVWALPSVPAPLEPMPATAEAGIDWASVMWAGRSRRANRPLTAAIGPLDDAWDENDDDDDDDDDDDAIPLRRRGASSDSGDSGLDFACYGLQHDDHDDVVDQDELVLHPDCRRCQQRMASLLRDAAGAPRATSRGLTDGLCRRCYHEDDEIVYLDDDDDADVDAAAPATRAQRLEALCALEGTSDGGAAAAPRVGEDDWPRQAQAEEDRRAARRALKLRQRQARAQGQAQTLAVQISPLARQHLLLSPLLLSLPPSPLRSSSRPERERESLTPLTPLTPPPVRKPVPSRQVFPRPDYYDFFNQLY